MPFKSEERKKEYNREYNLKHYQENREVILAYHKQRYLTKKKSMGIQHAEYYQTHKEARSVRSRNIKYGIDSFVFDELSKQQEYKCAICGRNPYQHSVAVLDKRTGKPRSHPYNVLNIDHDHTTGVIRGLLCSACNRAIGFFGDDIERLKKAVEYLTRTSRPAAGVAPGVPTGFSLSR